MTEICVKIDHCRDCKYKGRGAIIDFPGYALFRLIGCHHPDIRYLCYDNPMMNIAESDPIPDKCPLRKEV